MKIFSRIKIALVKKTIQRDIDETVANARKSMLLLDQYELAYQEQVSKEIRAWRS